MIIIIIIIIFSRNISNHFTTTTTTYCFLRHALLLLYRTVTHITVADYGMHHNDQLLSQLMINENYWWYIRCYSDIQQTYLNGKFKTKKNFIFLNKQLKTKSLCALKKKKNFLKKKKGTVIKKSFRFFELEN